ncbi:MAG: swr complex subunit [Trizodia sp. TS-e1964]|nr:MAG: swr complex subunit [Trizodia sp. TS-e1964]
MAAPVSSTALTDQLLTDEDESADEDFSPALAPVAAEASSSDSEDESEAESKRPAKKRKVKLTKDAELDFDNSGDEATIRKARRSRKRNGHADEDDEGGDGGLIKTRSQRAKELTESKPLASTDKATVDVDALWATMMMKPPTNTTSLNTPLEAADPALGDVADNSLNKTKPPIAPEDDMVKISRSYDFAGETIREEKLVPKASAEARLYLESLQSTSEPPAKKNPPGLRRPKKRVSMFEPNPDGIVKGLPASASSKPNKLNTVEKSKLDWAGFVDKEGIATELDEHSRAKDGYLGRMDFLGRVEAKKSEDLKRARGK